MMIDCEHDFKPRYQNAPTSIDISIMNDSTMNIENPLAVKNPYLFDICVKCGEKINVK